MDAVRFWGERLLRFWKVLEGAVSSTGNVVTTLGFLCLFVSPRFSDDFGRWVDGHRYFYGVVVGVWLLWLLASGYARDYRKLERQLAEHKESDEAVGTRILLNAKVEFGNGYSKSLAEVLNGLVFNFLDGYSAHGLVAMVMDQLGFFHHPGRPATNTFEISSEQEVDACKKIEEAFLELELLGLLERLPGSSVLSGSYGSLKFRLTPSGKRMVSRLGEAVAEQKAPPDA